MERDTRGRRKRPKHPPIKHQLSERLVKEDGSLEPIEEWIMRDAEKLVEERADARDQRELLRRLKVEKGEIGSEMAREKTKLETIQKEHRDAIKRLKAEQAKEVSAQKREIGKAKTRQTHKIRKIKTEEAVYNTIRNRYFTAVRNKVMQRMREICNIQHTWKDPQVKRDIQTAEIQTRKVANRRWKQNIEQEIENE